MCGWLENDLSKQIVGQLCQKYNKKYMKALTNNNTCIINSLFYHLIMYNFLSGNKLSVLILLLKRPFPVLSKRKRQLLNFNLNFRLISLLLPYIIEIVPIYWKSIKNGLMDDYMEYLTIRGITWTESSKGNVPIHVILSGIQLKLGRIATLLTTQLLHYKLLFFFKL